MKIQASIVLSGFDFDPAAFQERATNVIQAQVRTAKHDGQPLTKRPLSSWSTEKISTSVETFSMDVIELLTKLEPLKISDTAADVLVSVSVITEELERFEGIYLSTDLTRLLGKNSAAVDIDVNEKVIE